MGIYRGDTLNQQADTYKAVCFGKYLGSFAEIAQAAIAVDDYRISNNGKWKDLTFSDRYPKPPEKPKRRFAKPVRDVDEQTRRLWYLFSKVRCNADLRKIEFSIKREYLVELWEKQSGKCVITGRQMTLDEGKGRLWSAASVDRIDNGFVFERGNHHQCGKNRESQGRPFKIDLLAAPPLTEAERKLVKINKPRIRPKEAKNIHGYLTVEAVTIEENLLPINIAEKGYSTLEVYLPHPFSYLAPETVCAARPARRRR